MKNFGIQKRLFIYSLAFFVIISLVICGIYRIIESRSSEREILQQVISTGIEKNQSLTTSVEKEIYLSLVMTRSPLIHSYFKNPDDQELKPLFFKEMAAYQSAFKDNVVFWANDKDKGFYFNCELSYIIDINDPNEYWYKMTLYETDLYNLNINYNPELDAINLWVNAPVFISGTPVGMLGTGINLTDFVSEIFSDPNETVETILFNTTGEITGHKDRDLISTKATIFNMYPSLQDTLQKAMALADGWLDENFFTFTLEGTSYLGNINKIADIDWYVFTYKALNVKNNFSNMFVVLPLILLMLVVLVIFNVFVRRLVLLPIVSLRSTLAEMATGNLNAHGSITSKDELGALSSSIDQIGLGLTKLIRGINEKINGVEELSQKLNDRVNSTNDAVKDIVFSIDQTNNDMQLQSGNVSLTSNTVSALARQIGVLGDAIGRQEGSIEESSAAIEEMISNIKSISNMNAYAEGKVVELESSSEVGLNNVKEVSTMISEINEKSQNLIEANSLIAGIAAQTNLLAMNAAIEAAHAGNHGKGFAVVADEIRKLAEQSAEQSKNVNQSISVIQNAIESVVQASSNTSDSFSKIKEEIQEVSNAFASVKGAMEEQVAGGERVFASLVQMKDISNEVVGYSKEMREGNKSLMDTVEAFKQSTQAIESAIKGILNRVEHIRTEIGGIESLSEGNRDYLAQIIHEMDKFELRIAE